MHNYKLYISEKFSRRKKKGKYRKYNDEALQLAVSAVQSGGLSQTQASRIFGVPRQTIWHRLEKMKEEKLNATSFTSCYVDDIQKNTE